MPQFGRQGDLFTVAYITGPRHVWLGLRLSRAPVGAPTVVRRASIGECAHGAIDEASLVAAVQARLRSLALHAERIEYVENDSPVYDLYAHCAGLLGERYLRDPEPAMDARTAAQLRTLKFAPAGAVDRAAVAALQRDLSWELPDDYAAFLTATGGGGFDATVRCRCSEPPPIAVEGRAGFGWFLGLSGTDSLATARGRAMTVWEEPDLLPIADGDGGDFYCLCRSGPAADVVYWDHDSGKSHVVAASFADLVSRLEIDDAPQRNVRAVSVRLDPDLLR